MAELVDALDSGSSGRKPVEVRVLSGALRPRGGRGRKSEEGRVKSERGFRLSLFALVGSVAQMLELVDRPD